MFYIGLSSPKKHYSRLVFVLIDALRADFVLPGSVHNLPKMEFLRNKILRNESYSFIAKAHPPTVTLPRIKVMSIFYCIDYDIISDIV